MDLQLTGKRALVTGSSSGIGAGIAATLASEGASVVVHGRDAARCEQTAVTIRQGGGEAIVLCGDLTEDDDCQALCEAALSALGGIDILVNNAGGRACTHRTDGKGGPINAAWLDTPWSDWRWTFEQNVGGAVRMIQRLVPGMKARGWGRVINIASAAATQTEPDLADYQAAKAALVNLSASLARTLSRSGITVNTVSPGVILTPAVVKTFTHTAQQLGWNARSWDDIERRLTTELIPVSVDRLGQTGDVGRIVTWLASPLSGYMTGANYRVDGGQCRSIN